MQNTFNRVPVLLSHVSRTETILHGTHLNDYLLSKTIKLEEIINNKTHFQHFRQN